MSATFLVDRENDPIMAVERLIDLLQLKQIGPDLFEGPIVQATWLRVYGGQFIAQALRAAMMTVTPDKQLHSCHSYFLKPGDPALPITFAVQRDTDGRSFSARRVTAYQSDCVIYTLSASFHVPEPGYSYQSTMPDVPQPETLEDGPDVAMRNIDQILPPHWGGELRRAPLLMRWCDLPARYGRHSAPPRQCCWIKVTAPLPDDADLHRLVLAYASDEWLLAACLLPHGKSWGRGEVREASLDHSIWFHAPARLDDWLLYVQETPWSGAARGLNLGWIYHRDGELLATIAQEGLIRPIVA